MPNVEGIITENIRDVITPGLTVYDKEGAEVGDITDARLHTGYMTVETGPFGQKNLYIPFRLITTIDPRELYLSLTKDELHRQYADPPPRTVVVEESDGSEIAVTSEPSGYDGLPMVVHRVSIGDLRKRIVPGDHVYTSDWVELGTVNQYDSLSGWMLVEKSSPADKHDLMVPVSVAAEVDDTSHYIRLVTSQADLQRMQHLEPANVVFVEAQIAEAG